MGEPYTVRVFIPGGDPEGTMQGPRYISLPKLLAAKRVSDLFA